MKKIVMLNRISIDGFFASLNEATWGMDWFIPDPQVDKAAHEIGGNAAAPKLILGGVTYRGFERSWVPHLTNPNSPPPMKAVAEELTNMTKIVFSKTLKEVTWKNTKLYHDNLIEEVRKLKKESETDIMIMGSGSIVQQLTAAGLIDEYVFIVTPVVAGSGKPLFKEVSQFSLKLLSSQGFDSGNILVRYSVKR